MSTPRPESEPHRNLRLPVYASREHHAGHILPRQREQRPARAQQYGDPQRGNAPEFGDERYGPEGRVRIPARIRLWDLPRNRLQLLRHLTAGDSGLQTGKHAEPATVPSSVAPKRQQGPKSERMVAREQRQQREVLRHHADDGVVVSVKPNGAADASGVGVEMLFPERVAQDHGRGVLTRFVLRYEPPAMQRLHAQRPEQAGGAQGALDRFRRIAA